MKNSESNNNSGERHRECCVFNNNVCFGLLLCVESIQHASVQFERVKTSG